VAVDATLLQAGRLHKIAERAALVPAFIEDRRGGLDNLPACLVAFGHKPAHFQSDETARSLLIVSPPSVIDAARDRTVSEESRIEEINERGGILLRETQPVVIEGASDQQAFARQAEA
jgi:hypothetical protein